MGRRSFFSSDQMRLPDQPRGSEDKWKLSAEAGNVAVEERQWSVGGVVGPRGVRKGCSDGCGG